MLKRALKPKTAHRAAPRAAAPSHVFHPKSGEQRDSVHSILHATAIQPKLTIGQPNDQYEREADQVADHVVAGQQIPAISSLPPGGLSGKPPAQRANQEEDEKQLQRQPEEEEEETAQAAYLQMKETNKEDEEQQAQPRLIQAKAEPEEEEKPIQAKGAPHSAAAAEQAVRKKSDGQPLRPDVRSTLERRMETDLSDVRVHEGAEAREATRAIRARAFTHKNDIWLGEGQSQSDLHLMAHETTHVLQQGSVARRKPRWVSDAAPSIQGSWLGDAWSAVKDVGHGVVSAAKSAVATVSAGLGAIKVWALRKVAGFANDIPGFTLLCVILGRNPITDMPVARNAMNLTRGIMGLIPGGDVLFQHLQQSGALKRAFDWFSDQIEKLNLTWATIKGLFQQAWDSLSILDLRAPFKAFAKLKRIFLPPLIRIKNFAVAVGKKVLEFIFEGALKLAGPAGQQVLAVLRRGKQAFFLIIKDPVGFVGNLIKAVGQGFRQFSANIWVHLKQGLMGWLFGALGKAGLTMPEKFDLKGIVSIVLQVLGLTYQRLRGKLVKLIGEKNVERLETAFEFVRVLVTEGIAAAWQKLVEYMGNLKDMVLDAIKEWVVTKIVKAAITKLVSMFNPVGAIIQAVITIYNTIMFFIERAKQIMALVNSIFQSVVNIATGKLKAAADYVEMTMARTIPVIISFLARLLGLGGIADKIKGVILKIQAKVDMALDKLIGFIISKAKALFSKGKKAVGAVAAKVKSWWTGKKEFTAKDGKKHTFYFKGQGRSARLMMKSDPVAYADYVARVSVPDNKKEDKKRAMETARKLDAEIQKSASNQGDEITAASINGLLDTLATQTAAFMPASDQGSTDPVYGGLYAGSYGTVATVLRLGPIHQKGSDAKGGNWGGTPWGDLSRRYYGGDTMYVKGHLLNAQLGGPGNDWKNLTPITRYANNMHKSLFENTVKLAVNGTIGTYNRPSATGSLKTVNFVVQALYGRQGRQGLVDNLKNAGGSDDQTIARIIEAEQNIPIALDCRATDVHQNTVVAAARVDNVTGSGPIEAVAYNIGPFKQEMVIDNINDAAALQKLDGIGVITAQKIIDEKKKKPFRRHGEIEKLIGKERWRKARATAGYNVRLYKITLK